MRARSTRLAAVALTAAAVPLSLAGPLGTAWATVPVASAAVSSAAVSSAAGPGSAAGTTSRLVVAPGFAAACAHAAGPHSLRCYAQWRSTSPVQRGRTTLAARPIQGLTPVDLRSAYALTGASGTGTVAVIEGADDPKAEADLAFYRRHFGLPACTTANGCFRKVNVRGAKAPLPPADPGWGLEMSLDLQAVSAVCPRCHLLLVETPGNTGLLSSISALSRGNATAVRLGATAVSNSWGAAEFTGVSALAHDFRHPGVPILASTGDDGFGPASFPASLPRVVGVAGTTLVRAKATGRGWRERAWGGSGSGCSAYFAKPAWQHDTHCAGRTLGDIAADADPETGLALYDTYGLGDQAGWVEGGGTSLSSPLVAGMWVASGHARGAVDASAFYRRGAAVHDVIGGSTGYCGGDYLCTAVKGYDSPTGVGTPNGPLTFSR